MNEALRALLARGGGLITLGQATQVVPRWVVEHAHRRGALRWVLPGVYLAAPVAADPVMLRRAVLAWAHGRGALSHTTALEVWDLLDPAPARPVHLTVPDHCGLRTRPGVTVHHRAGFAVAPPHARIRAGHAVTPVERAG